MERDCRGVLRNVNTVNARNPTVRACYECGSTDHVRSACPRLNRARGPEENRPNQVAANNGGQGRGNQGNQARGRAFMSGAEEARQDPNIMTGLEPSDLGFRFEIKIASGKLVEIDKVIKCCKLEIKGHVFDIDLFLGHVKMVMEFKEDPSKIRAVKIGKPLELRPREQNWQRQTLKDKLCNAPVLALPDGPEDFVLYKDKEWTHHNGSYESSAYLWSGKSEYATAIRLIELFSDYDCEICYHPGKANVVADPLSRKERVKPKRVRAMNMILQSSIKDRILAAQKEVVHEFAVLQKGLDEMIEQRNDGTLYYLDQIWVPLKGEHRHGVPISIISDRDSRFTIQGFGQSNAKALGTRLKGREQSMAYNPQTDRHSERYYSKTLEDMLRALRPKGLLIGPELVQETTEKISQIKDRLKAARDHQKSYADKRRKPLEFSVGDYVLLKVSPWKGVVRFGKKRKLAPRFVGPFEIIKKVGHVAYRLDLPEELNGVHDTFHVSNLKKCLADPTLKVPLDEIRVDAKLNFVEEPVEILEREFKKLKRSRIAIVKVRWNSKNVVPEFYVGTVGGKKRKKKSDKLKYPHLFSDVSS
ncbi:putative reverse transcriptase domain-containing protein [Tanacetum coccineum]